MKISNCYVCEQPINSFQLEQVILNSGKPVPFQIRFWAYVVKSNGCWLWNGARDEYGYGIFPRGPGESRLAHRVSWELAYGRIQPTSLLLRHKCDNPSCVNPNHLILGTHQDNSDDAVKRDRSLKGEKCPTSKLTNKQVLEIKNLLKNEKANYTHIARHYGVSRVTISMIASGKRWEWLT